MSDDEIEFDDVVEDNDVYVERDFVQKIAESLPMSMSKWLNDGDKKTRMIKFGGLVLLIIFIIAVIFGIIIGITFLVNLASSSSESSSNCCDGSSENQDYFLPDWALPISYQITLNPNLRTFELSGTVQLLFTITEDGHNELILNSKNITISTVEFIEKEISMKEIEYDDEHEMIIITFSSTLPANENIEILISYEGTIQEDMAGFYRSVYTDDNGEEHWLASTQFEPTAARLAFPCFDEPDKKAKFTITLNYDDTGNTVSLSNMPVASSTTKNGKTSVTFEETPIMSSYLVAFLVGDFDNVEGVYRDIPIKVWAPVGQEEQGEIALNVTISALEFYEDFFNEPYTLPKLDLIAIPDFEAGAMENWGLITFRLTALLYNSAEDTSANLQRVATVVTHELAHQWTGDLVTMGWWSNLWLNEGFADFFETESVANIFTSWNMRDQFLFEDQQRAFSVDSLVSTHPIVNIPVITSSDISEMFDTITYSKGGSILRMMQDVLSPDVFKSGLQDYINNFKYGNVLTDDFLDSMSDSTGEDINTNFYEWFYNPGYPVINVELKGKDLTFTQERFFSSAITDQIYDDTEPWWVNIKYETSNGVEDEISFKQSSQHVQLSHSTDYIKANLRQNGYFRVNYPTTMWNDIKENIFSYSVADRVGLVNDILVLARSGRQSTTTALEFTSFLSSETDYSVWISALSELGYIGTMLTTEADYGLYELFIQSLISDAVEYVGWGTLASQNVTIDHNQSLLRSSILNFAVRFELPSVINQALDIWQNYKENDEPISPDDRQAVYCAALYYGDSSDYYFLFNHLLETDNAAEQKRVLYTLGCTREFYLLKSTLDISLDPNIVRPQDQRTVIAGVSANPLGRDLAWNFVQENFETFNVLGFSLSSLITTVTSPFNDEFHLKEVETFFEMQDTIGASMAVTQSEETIEANINWLKTNGEEISQWLISNFA